MDAIIDIARLEKVKSMAIVGQYFVKPLKLGNWRLLHSRVTLLSSLLYDVYTDCTGSGLSVEAVVKFLSPCLEHSNRQVRESAVKLTVDLYNQYGRQVCRWLPVKENSPETKKGFWKSLYDNFEHSNIMQ
jgi:hypothetical protein